MTGDRVEAEDIAQEALVRVYERWGQVGGMDSPTGYLYRTAMNLARSRLRCLRGAPSLSVPSEDQHIHVRTLASTLRIPDWC